MAFLIVGLLMALLKFTGIDPFASMSWFTVLIPFGLAVAWWAFADASGLTKRRAAEKMEQRKQERRERDMKALGLNVKTGAQRGRVVRNISAAPPPAARSERDN